MATPDKPGSRGVMSPDAITAALLQIHAAIAARKTSPMEAVLAEEFGRRNGWQVSDRPFSISQLRLGTDDFDDEFMHPMGDHADFFRTPNGRPAAVAAHLYDPQVDRILAWAAVNLLQVSFPKFPSWYNPCKTLLVLYFSTPGMVAVKP